MWKSDLSKITLVDVIDAYDVSVRTSNCIKSAIDEGLFSVASINSVKDYIHAGDMATVILKRLPNMGRKSVEELNNIIHEVFEAGGLDVFSMEILNESDDTLSDVMKLRLSGIVESNITSERLKNSILQAEKDGALPIETVGEYVQAGTSALRTMLRIQFFGKKTADELDLLIKGVLDDPDSYKGCENGNTNIIRVESTVLDMDASDVQERLLEKFQDLLKEREYGVLKHRAIEGKTLEESGEIYDVTRERIRQIEKKAKLKLLKVYRSIFNQVASNIDRILDDSYGEVSLLDAAIALNMTEDVLKLLVFICADQCKKPVRIRRGYLYRTSTESNHLDWNEAIDEVLYSLEWPIYVGWIYDGLKDIPHSYIDRYLEKNRGAKLEEGVITELKKIPRSARMLYVLRDAGHALHSSEIARRYGLMFGQDIQEHNAQTVVARMDEALIVDRGVYSLYELLDVTEETIEEVRRRTYNYIKNEEKYVSSKVLYEELFKNNVDYQEINTAYIVHGILQDDDRFVIRRGLMVGIKDHKGFVEFKPLNEEVHGIVEDKGPLSVSQIKETMSDQRNVFSVNISKILENSKRIIRIAPGSYDAITNVFGDSGLFEDLKLAIKIALSDHDHGLFELTTNIRTLEMFNGIEINKSILSSILDLMPDVTRKGQTYSINSLDAKIGIYNDVINSVNQNKTKYQLQEEIGLILGSSELSRKYIAADYRTQSFGDDISSINLEQDNNSEISSILSAFEI